MHIQYIHSIYIYICIAPYGDEGPRNGDIHSVGVK